MLIMSVYQHVQYINIKMLMDCNKELELPHVNYGVYFT